MSHPGCEIGVRGQYTNVLGELLAPQGVLQAGWHGVNSQILIVLMEILASEMQRYSPLLALYIFHTCSLIYSDPSSVHLELTML